jgi:hypothetical protein
VHCAHTISLRLSNTYDDPNVPSAGLIVCGGGGGFYAISANFPKTGLWADGGKGEGSIGADGERFMPKSFEGAYK